MANLQVNVMLLAMAVIWLLPMIDIVRSSKVDKDEKIFWICSCLALSWFCWILFYAFAPLKKRFS